MLSEYGHGGSHPLLGLDDPRPSDELHRPRDLLGRLHRLDSRRAGCAPDRRPCQITALIFEASRPRVQPARSRRRSNSAPSSLASRRAPTRSRRVARSQSSLSIHDGVVTPWRRSCSDSASPSLVGVEAVGVRRRHPRPSWSCELLPLNGSTTLAERVGHTASCAAHSSSRWCVERTCSSSSVSNFADTSPTGRSSR